MDRATANNAAADALGVLARAAGAAAEAVADMREGRAIDVAHATTLADALMRAALAAAPALKAAARVSRQRAGRAA